MQHPIVQSPCFGAWLGRLWVTVQTLNAAPTAGGPLLPVIGRDRVAAGGASWYGAARLAVRQNHLFSRGASRESRESRKPLILKRSPPFLARLARMKGASATPLIRSSYWLDNTCQDGQIFGGPEQRWFVGSWSDGHQ